ncbi:hypothetical protein GCM10010442_54350 [Kitasatospora kifunensis]
MDSFGRSPGRRSFVAQWHLAAVGPDAAPPVGATADSRFTLWRADFEQRVSPTARVIRSRDSCSYGHHLLGHLLDPPPKLLQS